MSKRDISILIVDDELAVQRFLSTCLGLDYGCVTAESGEKAIELLNERSFELVVTDLVLPGISGVQLCSEIRRACPDTVIIAMSGMCDIRPRVEAMRQGALYFVEKPINTSGLHKLVEAALNSRATAAARRKAAGWSAGDSFAVRTETGTLLN